MKKLLYSILALAGVVATSCTQEHIDVQYIPENAVAPVLGTIEGCTLSEGGADIVVEYTKANFGVQTASTQALYVAKTADMEGMKKVKAAFGDANITMTQADLNIVALDFAEAGTDVELHFAILANLNTDKGAAVAGTELMSNVVSATFKSFVAEVLPVEKFAKMYVVGTLNGWDHAAVEKEYDFLYNYDAGNSNLFAGIIDLREPNSAAEFKLTAGGWGNDEHSMSGAHDAEATTVTLVAGGGDNINVWQTKRFYAVEFDKGAPSIKKSWSADQIGVIGLNGDWDNDIVMEYNAKWTRFYADIEATGDTEMKFRADAGWDLNWGVDCANGGDNIKVAAGKYRVYFNPVTGLIEFNAKKYGTEEDTAANGGGSTPEPEGPVTEPDRWGVVGTLTSWGGSADLYMNEVGENLLVRTGVTLTADDQFKVRFNNDWAVNAGAAGDVEPFAVTVGEELELVGGGKNLSAPAGTYDIYFNTENYKMWVMTAGETPGGIEVKSIKIYGDLSATGWTNANAWIWDAADVNYTGGNWPGQALSTETVDGKEYYVFNATPEMIGKTVNVIFNNGSEQTVDINGVELKDNVIITLTEKGDDGKWLATVNGETPAEPEKPAVTTYGLIGEFNGWGAPDVDLVDRGDGWFVATGLTMEGKFLIRLNDGWDEKFGFAAENTYAQLGENELTAGGADMWINAGSYDIYFNPTTAKMFVANAGEQGPAAPADVWVIKGDVNGTQWSTEVATEEANGLYVAKNVTFQDSWNEGANFKVLKNGAWMGSVAGGVHELNTAIAVSADANTNITMNVTLDTPYDIYIDGANNNVYVVEAGATPAI